MFAQIPFLCCLQSIAAHRDHFVWRLSVCPSGSHTFFFVTCLYFSQASSHIHFLECCHSVGAVVAEWLSPWLAEQEDGVSIPGLATWIFKDWLSPASKSRYGWKIAKSTLIIKTTNQAILIHVLWPFTLLQHWTVWCCHDWYWTSGSYTLWVTDWNR